MASSAKTQGVSTNVQSPGCSQKPIGQNNGISILQNGSVNNLFSPNHDSFHLDEDIEDHPVFNKVCIYYINTVH